jgi:molybdate-binding protein
MAAESTATHRVAVFAAPDDIHDLSRVLAEVLGMHPTDAAVHARNAPGVLPDRLTAEQAKRLAAAIRETGLHAEALAGESIPEFEHAEVVHHLRCLDDGLEIVELHGATE